MILSSDKAAFTFYFKIQAGVPQGSNLSPDLYKIFSDIPNYNKILITTYADDTAILS